MPHQPGWEVPLTHLGVTINPARMPHYPIWVNAFFRRENAFTELGNAFSNLG